MEESDRNSNSCHTDSDWESNVDDSNMGSEQYWCCFRVRNSPQTFALTHIAIAVLNQEQIQRLIESKYEILKKTLIGNQNSKLLKDFFVASREKQLPNSPEKIMQCLTARDEKTREERKELNMLFRLICQVTRLLVLFCLSIVYGKTKARLRYTYEKASLLILWHCGDVEPNPGPGPPTVSDISRDFCKKMISLLVIRYWDRKEGRELTQADYKKRPENWLEDTWYGDPSTCTNKDRNAMLRGLYNACLVQEVAIPNEWLVLTDKYERSQDKQCSKAEKTQYAKDLQSWLRKLRSLEALDHFIDTLPEDSREKNYVLEQAVERLKPHLPDLFQSRKAENKPATSQDTSILGQCSYTYLSVNGGVPSEHNTIHADGRTERINNITAQNDLMTTLNQSSHSTANSLPDVLENGITADSTEQADQFHDDQGWLEDFLADSTISFVEYPTTYIEETHLSNSKACKRKDASHEGSDIMVLRSKRQKHSEDFDFLQSTEKTDRVKDVVTPYTTTENEDCTDTTWDDLMDIIQPELQEGTTRPEDIPVSDLDTVIHEDIPGDIKELSSYLFG